MKNSHALAIALTTIAGHAAAQPAAWNNPAGGNWNTASNWTPAAVPNAPTIDAVLGLTDAYAVLCNLSPSLATLAITNPLATLDIPGGNTISVSGGLLHNDGLIRINSNATIFNAALAFPATASVTGTGMLHLGAPSGEPDIFDAQLSASAGAVVTIGQDQLISGNGVLTGQGAFIAQGTIRPTGPATPGIQLRTALTMGPAAEIDLANARFDLGTNASLTDAHITGPNPLRTIGSAVRIAGLTLDAPFDLLGTGTTTSIDASITNNDTITINSNDQVFNAVLRFETASSIAGNGVIRMRTAGSSDDAQLTTAEGVTGTIGAGQTVSGSGRIGGSINLLGAVAADNQLAPLELRGTISGPGLLRAENNARLSFVNANLSNLTIQTASGGSVGADSGTTTASGIVNNGQAYIAGNATTLALTGALTNNGTLTINSTDQVFNALLRIDTPAGIAGNGSILMRTFGNTDDARITTAPGVTATIGSGQAVSGSGRIEGDLILLGSFTATNPIENLELRGAVTGPGTLRAENAGFLSFISADLTDLTIETTTNGRVGARSGVTTASDITNTGNMVIAGLGTTLAMSGNLNNNATLTLNPDDQVFNAILRFDTDATIGGTGAVIMRTAGNVDDAQIVVAETVNTTIGADQTVRGSGILQGSFTNLGVINADDPAQILDLRGNFTGPGLIRADAGRAAFNNASISGHTFDSADGGIVTARIGISTILNSHNLGTLGIDGLATTLIALGTLTNDGVILINATDTVFNAILELANPAGIVGQGEIILESSGALNDAQIRVPDASSAALGTGQTLSGTGQIRGQLTVTGDLRPAGDLRRIDAATPGTLLSLAPSTRSTFELAGTALGQFGRITAVNTASIDLDGACVVRLDPGYTPVRGDSWDIVSAQNRTGEFATFDFPPAPFGLTYRVFYQPGRVFVRLTCSSDFDGDNVLNFFDVSTYLALFNAQDPRADLSAPFGQFNFFDIAAFINNFNAGCP